MQNYFASLKTSWVLSDILIIYIIDDILIIFQLDLQNT